MERTGYTTNYSDKNGEIATTIWNDGKVLSLSLREIEFSGSDFDSLSPVKEHNPSELSLFTLNHNCLCSCTISTIIPVPVISNNRLLIGNLHIHLELGEPKENGGIDREELFLNLSVENRSVKTRKTFGWFDDALGDIHSQLEKGVYIKSCFNCAFSDYYPGGYGLFGCLACFRDSRELFVNTVTKTDLLKIWSSMTEFVQEIYLCPEFLKAPPSR